MGVLLVGGSHTATAAAAPALEQALPRDCRNCLLVFKVRMVRTRIHTRLHVINCCARLVTLQRKVTIDKHSMHGLHAACVLHTTCGLFAAVRAGVHLNLAFTKAGLFHRPGSLRMGQQTRQEPCRSCWVGSWRAARTAWSCWRACMRCTRACSLSGSMPSANRFPPAAWCGHAWCCLSHANLLICLTNRCICSTLWRQAYAYGTGASTRA